MEKQKILDEYEKRLFPLTIPTYDEELIVRYYDAIETLRVMLDEMQAKEELEKEKHYDFWDSEI